MADSHKIETRYNYFWIHNVFGSFIKDTMDYFADYLYPRITWKVIGTYDKAVEYYNKTILLGRESDQPQLPGLILDPSGDFNVDETYGKFLYRFPNLAPGQLKYVYDPIYQDENILITVGFSRFIGEINFIGLMSSFYEYYDMKVFLNLIFGGNDRPIYPRYFTSFIILPEEIKSYKYENDVTGLSYNLNIENSYSRLVKTTNTNEVVFPVNIKPLYKLTGMSDASNRLGGTTNLPSYKLNFTVAYEIELPTFLVLESDYLAKTVKININYGSCYSVNNSYSLSTVPDSINEIDSTVDLGLDATSNSTVTFPEEATVTDLGFMSFKTRYYYIATHSDETSTTYIDITIPETIVDKDLLKVNTKQGLLVYGDEYTIEESGTIIRINKTVVSITQGDVIELYIYKRD